MHRARLFAAFSLIVIAILSIPFVATAASPPLLVATGDATAEAPRPQIEVVSSTPRGMTLEFELPALTVDEATAVDGRTYQIVGIPGGGSTGEIGQPEIPIFTRFVSIPASSGVRVGSATVLEEETLNGYHLSPMQSDENDAAGGDPANFAYDPAAYARDDFGGPALTAGALLSGGPSILRDLRLVPLSFQPVRYNPTRSVLKVARRIRVQVSFAGTDTENALPTASARPQPIAPSFDRIYRDLVVNYGATADGRDASVMPGTWIAICTSSDVATHLQPLVDWHKRKGIPVRVALTSEIGTTKEAIKAWLVNAYATWPVRPEYVTLCGDADGSYQIPIWYETVSGYNGGGDHPYAQLDGNDPLADVHIGRLSFQTLQELDTIVAKSVGYESTPYTATDPDWFTRACLVGDPSHSGISTVQVMQWTKTRLHQINYTQIDTIFSGDFVGQMTTDFNKGGTVLAYRGYIGMSGFGAGNINALTNGWKLPFAVIPTCDTGTFYSGTSRSEAFLRSGSTTTPKAGIGAIGTATIGTHTAFNNCLIYGILYGLLYEGDYAMGAALTRGKLEMYLNYQQRDPNRVLAWSYWNSLMGDPAVECWTGYPAAMSVSAPRSAPVGANSISVGVTEDGGQPCEGAQVCLSKGIETYFVGYTDGTGQIEAPVSLQMPGSLLLTVTKHNRMPYMATINVPIGANSVGYQSSTIDDDSTGSSHGNGDGIVNPGETIEFQVQVKNYGTQPAPGVTATLTSADPYVTIAQGTGDYGDIAAGGSAVSASRYVFSVSLACPHGRALRFGLDVASGADQWHSLIDIGVVSSHLLATGYTLSDAGSNGLLDPGETVQMSVKLNNLGSVAATGITGTLTSLSPMVSVLDGSGSWGDLPGGANGQNNGDPFAILAQSRTYNGYVATFRLVNNYSGGMSDTSLVSVPVGQRAATDPTGPDSHGYLAFDNTDTSYSEAPVYNWVELDPSYGGSGTQLPLNDFGQYQDASVVIDLPFPFTYYGQSYTRATVCSNGWIAMTSQNNTEYRNWTIPGAGGPQAMIAPFWDDLNVSGGKVLSLYDAVGHRFIVEWSRVHNDPGNGQVIEVILYDPAFYSTTTGDGPILFQYNAVNNTDSGDNYATVGIENIEHTDGLLYTFGGFYTGGSASLAAGRAIRFTTTIPGLAGAPDGAAGAKPIFALRQNTPNPWQRSTAIRFSLDKPQIARLSVYDVQGRTVRRLREGMQPAGFQTVIWDGRDERGTTAPAGLYFYLLDTAERREVRKLIRIE